MKSWILGALAAIVVAVSFAPPVAEAKRLGGGGSAGMQRSLPARSTPDAAPAKPAAPTQAAPATAGAVPAAAPKRSWMGPIAGLAAGLGIAALMSHLGMGEAFGNFLMLALLAVVAVVAIRFLMRRFAGGAAPAYAGAGAGTASGAAQVAWPQRNDAATAPLQRAADGSGPTAAQPMSHVPAGFDEAGFERIAKTIFIRLQAANDAADLNDLRQFTTPELFASVRLDLQERGDVRQQTDVLKVDAQVLDVAQNGPNEVVSVRFSGLIREQADAAANDFDEVWHMVKPSGNDSRGWAIAGIQQRH